MVELSIIGIVEETINTSPGPYCPFPYYKEHILNNKKLRTIYRSLSFILGRKLTCVYTLQCLWFWHLKKIRISKGLTDTDYICNVEQYFPLQNFLTALMRHPSKQTATTSQKCYRRRNPSVSDEICYAKWPNGIQPSSFTSQIPMDIRLKCVTLRK